MRSSKICQSLKALFLWYWWQRFVCVLLKERKYMHISRQKLNESLKGAEWSISLWEEQTRLRQTDCRVLHRADSKLPWQPQTDRQTDRTGSREVARHKVSLVSRA